MRTERFQTDHLRRLRIQPAQEYLFRGDFDPETFSYAEKEDEAWTVFDGETVLGCGGIVTLWPGRGMAWTYLAQNLGPRFIACHREVVRSLSRARHNRVEAYVDVDFPAGHRWMTALGFRMEAPFMEAYRPDGGACSLYARVKHGSTGTCISGA